MRRPCLRSVLRRALVGGLGAGLAAALPAGGLAAQSDTELLAEACGGGFEALRPACLEAALAFQSTAGIVGLAGSGGAELPGSSSTLGRRLGNQPRIGLALRVGGAGGAVPDVLRDDGEQGERGAAAPMVQGVMALGLFDGFSPLPTVGGLFSLDVLGSAGRVFLPGGPGFAEGTNVFGLGARVGLLRESFTLPGVTLSAARRWAGEVRMGEPTTPDGAGLTADVAATSLRATVGKDLLALGLLAGVGWDRYNAEGTVRARHRNGPSDEDWMAGAAEVTGFRADRTLFYGGASFTFLVLQLSAELGWARGFDAVEGRAGAPYDPTAGRFFGSLAGRLTL